MKVDFYLTISALFLLFIQNISFAQSEGFDKPLIKKSEKDSVQLGAIRPVSGGLEIKIKKPEGYPAKDLAENYTGFRIEIMATDSLLPDTSEVFFRHGNMVMEQLEGAKFSYTVGDFKDEQSAQSFMDKFIRPMYPEPRIVRYQEGKRE